MLTIGTGHRRPARPARADPAPPTDETCPAVPDPTPAIRPAETEPAETGDRARVEQADEPTDEHAATGQAGADRCPVCGDPII
ncbi:hypothetical protein [Nocardia beijingensis]|uniref:hypothetical protein n=1 Tax=Nocardia beijingensis TaxID=95162 RepID=UPI0033FBE5C5